MFASLLIQVIKAVVKLIALPLEIRHTPHLGDDDP